MFDLPERSELFRLRDEEYADWMEDISERSTVILGSDPASLLAGRVLQRQGKNTLILEESEQLGGRLLWNTGPIPVASPADELLEDLDFPVMTNPPLWLDRLDLLDFLLHGYLEDGGSLVTGVYIENLPELESPTELEFFPGEQGEVITVEQGIICSPRYEIDFDPPDESPLEAMVRRTRVMDSGWVIAGMQALNESERDQEYPYVNGELLSGRKAVECILSRG